MRYWIFCLCLAFSLLMPCFSLPLYSEETQKSAAAHIESIPDGKIIAPDKSMIDAFRISLKGADGIKFGDTFTIMRGDKVIAEAYLVSTDSRNCVISIKGTPSGEVQPGDVVRFVRHKKELPREVLSHVTYLGLFKNVEGKSNMVCCSKCGLQIERSFLSNFNETDHYAVCQGKTHEFYCRSTTAKSSGSSSQGQSTQQGSATTNRNAQEVLKAPENWTEKVSTTKYEDWGKTVKTSTLPTIGGCGGPPVVSGYGTSGGKEIKMQIIQGSNCIKVVSP
ncbi:MAG: hypothetical protein RDV48_22605 [Candidatus Eremiobacteraeota bacterium]|nr:hypothetical protein [Candidatus Eremiobacteraeota bacterium]